MRQERNLKYRMHGKKAYETIEEYCERLKIPSNSPIALDRTEESDMRYMFVPHDVYIPRVVNGAWHGTKELLYGEDIVHYFPGKSVCNHCFEIVTPVVVEQSEEPSEYLSYATFSALYISLLKFDYQQVFDAERGKVDQDIDDIADFIYKYTGIEDEWYMLETSLSGLRIHFYHRPAIRLGTAEEWRQRVGDMMAAKVAKNAIQYQSPLDGFISNVAALEDDHSDLSERLSVFGVLSDVLSCFDYTDYDKILDYRHGHNEIDNCINLKENAFEELGRRIAPVISFMYDITDSVEDDDGFRVSLFHPQNVARYMIISGLSVRLYLNDKSSIESQLVRSFYIILGVITEVNKYNLGTVWNTLQTMYFSHMSWIDDDLQCVEALDDCIREKPGGFARIFKVGSYKPVIKYEQESPNGKIYVRELSFSGGNALMDVESWLCKEYSFEDVPDVAEFVEVAINPVVKKIVNDHNNSLTTSVTASISKLSFRQQVTQSVSTTECVEDDSKRLVESQGVVNIPEGYRWSPTTSTLLNNAIQIGKISNLSHAFEFRGMDHLREWRCVSSVVENGSVVRFETPYVGGKQNAKNMSCQAIYDFYGL
jgi:hypothetical protein